MTQRPQFQMAVPFQGAVKALIIANVAIWVICQILLEGYLRVPFNAFFALYPGKVIYDFFIWQPVTYMFLHSLQWTHIVFNMLMLWWLGSELQTRWGSKFFLLYYFVTGAGAALIYTVAAWIYAAFFGGVDALIIPVVGASGAIFALMVAYGILFGERMVFFMMIFPMKARYFVMILGGIQVISLLTSGMTGGDVAYLAHIGGLISGYVFLKVRQQWQQRQWNAKLRKRGRNLRLVVDNEKNGDGKDPKGGPRYWN